MISYAVFHENKQLRVFPDVAGKDVALQKAIDLARASQNAGYPCSIEEFSFSYLIGVTVYKTEGAE